jgi:hypothetical protein
MTALTADRATPKRHGRDLNLPVATNAIIFAGAIVALSATGFAVKGAVATTLKGVGVARRSVNNTGGADGAVSLAVERGVWQFGNSASTDQITLADVGASCYIVDDQTVAKTNGGATRSVAGVIRDVDANGVWVEF